MTLPTVRFEVGFTSPTVAADIWVIGDPVRGQVGVAEIGSDDLWTDISEYVRSWSLRRGANTGTQPTRRYEPGTCSIELNDADRRFDPDNLDGPYVTVGRSEVQPMRRLRIVAEWDGTTYPLFFGFTDNWEPDYQGQYWTYVTVTATDGSKVLDNERAVAEAPIGTGESTGTRVARILNGMNWPTADRLLDTGASTLQATDLSGNGLSELHLVQDAELGELYIDTVGRVRFRSRTASLEEERSTTSQALFGDKGYWLPVTHDFESGVAGFTGFGATIAASTAQFYEGDQSLLMTVTGSPVQAYTRPSALAVHAGHTYTATMWVYYPVGGSVVAAIDWADSAGGYLSGAYETVAVAAGTWTQLTVTGAAPALAATAAFGPTLEGSPPNGRQLYLDDMRIVDDSNEIPYLDTKTANPSDGMANYVTITRGGGTAQQATDTTSIDRYLQQPYSRTDLALMSDAEALAYADAILYRHADPGRRFSEISFQTPPPALEGVAWPAVLDRDFGDRITIIRRPYTGGDPIQQDCFIRGVTHASDGVKWDTAFVLESAEKYSFFTVGHPELGQVGVYPITY